MGEFWDIYDENRVKTGRTAERDKYEFKEGEYHIVVTGIILNSKYEILISKRAPWKRHGSLWECNGGSILAGETSLEGILRELKEELGITFSEKDAIFLKEVKRNKKVPDFKDLWLFQKDISTDEISFPDGEATEAKWVTIEQFMNMYKNNEIVPTIDFKDAEYKMAVEVLKKMKSEKYYDNTESDMPRKNVKYFIENMKIQPGKAIDIGCGAGNDTVYLIKNGWSVTSIDKENVEERISKRLSSDEMKRFEFQKRNFENMQLEKADLIVANYSLSFCYKQEFDEMWKTIKKNIYKDGYFVGDFFGINDSWNKAESNMTFFTKEQVLKLFDEFDIIKFNEVEKDDLTGLGNMKHWHIFNVIAKKK